MHYNGKSTKPANIWLFANRKRIWLNYYYKASGYEITDLIWDVRWIGRIEAAIVFAAIFAIKVRLI